MMVEVAGRKISPERGKLLEGDGRLLEAFGSLPHIVRATSETATKSSRNGYGDKIFKTCLVHGDIQVDLITTILL